MAQITCITCNISKRKLPTYYRRAAPNVREATKVNPWEKNANHTGMRFISPCNISASLQEPVVSAWGDTIRAEIITKLIPQTIFLCNRDHYITQINSPENFLCNRLESPRIILCNWGSRLGCPRASEGVSQARGKASEGCPRTGGGGRKPQQGTSSQNTMPERLFIADRH